MEPVFRAMEIAGRNAVRLTGTRLTFEGLENMPAHGGAVIAINHTSYIDFLPAALAATNRKRRMRFMIKAEMQDVGFVNFLIKHSKTIPVDRTSGSDAFPVAVQRLKEGEIVGVYPEATISRSFELKDFKSGAARMALEANVPIVPLIVWGVHRIWTKDHPRNLRRNRIPVTVALAQAIPRRVRSTRSWRSYGCG
jgi:1-acyl-sn-glycerol-3-phosphate acyltransferase